ncbi:TRIM3 [Branchiostoma lanceolatum]|uniref:TRIM3 protein n=1 Tax=Branchiostoma lanceolatum TaxID=7740 RepID=A0A8J9YYM2_BRALA|nr:TRIM3 [Branchiostoma lanceolatum]
MLQADNKIGKGNLGLLVQILRTLGKGKLAKEAELLEQQQRRETAVHQTAPMSEAYCTLLLRNYPTIHQELDATRVLDHLHRRGVLTREMRQEILAIPERHRRTRRLLDLILQMDDDAFTIFRSALGHAGYRHLVELLTGGQQQQQQLMPPMPMALAIYPPKFEHFWGCCTSGDLSATLSELLLTEEMRGLEGGDQLVVRTLVLEKDVRAWTDFFQTGDKKHPKKQVESKPSHNVQVDPQHPKEQVDPQPPKDEQVDPQPPKDEQVDQQPPKDEQVDPQPPKDEQVDQQPPKDEQVDQQPPKDEQVEQVTSQLDTSRQTEELQIGQKIGSGSIRSSNSGYDGRMPTTTGFTIDVEGKAVQSLPCSITVTPDSTVGLTGGDKPHIEMTSPQGKTTLIQTTPHTSPPLAAGKGQTSRVRRVWGAEWRPQESGTHTLGVCMGGKKDLGSLTVHVGSNNPVLRLGQKGSQQGQFAYPRDVAVRGDRLYVADTSNKRVQVFDLSGNFCSSFSTTENPESLAVQIDGTIHVVVNSWQGVKKFSPSGELLHKFPLDEYCTRPCGLAVQRDGRVVVTDQGKHSIFLFEADGTLVKQVGGKGQGTGQFREPRFPCVDKEDNIIVPDTMNHRVQVFDKNLNFKHKFGQKGEEPEGMFGPMGVSADSRGNIVLANIRGEKLQVFHPDGSWLSTISSDGDQANYPHGVAVTEDGHVFVADFEGNCIRKYRYM